MSFPTPRNLVTPTDIRTQRAAPRPARTKSIIATREATLGSRLGRIDVAVASSCGTRHDVNEDAYSTFDGGAPVFVVTDGVGGGALASRVSRELVARLHGQLDVGERDAEDIRDALLDADDEISRTIASHTDASGAATVALCSAIDPALSRWLIAWVGDCRIYRIGIGKTEEAQLLSRDDTYRNMDEPAPAGGSPDDPARMVGNGAVDDPNVCETTLAPGEMLVLCSDGVHKHATAGEIARLMREPHSLARRCGRLIERARADGSHDDATVLVVRRGKRDWSPIARMLIVGGTAAVLAGTLGWMISGYSAADAAAPSVSPQPVSTETQP